MFVLITLSSIMSYKDRIKNPLWHSTFFFIFILSQFVRIIRFRQLIQKKLESFPTKILCKTRLRINNSDEFIKILRKIYKVSSHFLYFNIIWLGIGHLWGGGCVCVYVYVCVSWIYLSSEERTITPFLIGFNLFIS